MRPIERLEETYFPKGIKLLEYMEKVAVLYVPDYDIDHETGEQYIYGKPQPQKWCTQEERQEAYDNWETTDDHGMQIYGIAKDQDGNEYYMVKNSWGKAGKYNGVWYASKAFVRCKTMNIVVNKKALPKEIAKKLGIK